MNLDNPTIKTIEQREQNGEIFAFLKADATALLDRNGDSISNFLESDNILASVQSFFYQHLIPYLPEGNNIEICSISVATSGLSEAEFYNLYKDSYVSYLLKDGFIDENNNVMLGKEKEMRHRLRYYCSQPLILLTLKIEGSTSQESHEIFESAKRGGFRSHWRDEVIMYTDTSNHPTLMHPALGYIVNGLHTGLLNEASEILQNHEFIDIQQI